MKSTPMLALALTISLTLANSAVAAKSHGKGSSAVFIEPNDLDWKATPGFPGVQTATVEGNSEKGSHHAFTKFAAGFESPVHHHSADHFVTVVAGTLILTADGHEHRLPAGSYFSFKNKGKHSTACAAGADCVIFADVRSKWDVVPAKK